MPSNAATTFKDRSADIARLQEIHRDLVGATPGRKYGVEVLNRSAIVFLAAMWEGYVEDLVAEAIEHLVTNATDVTQLPKELRKTVAAELKADPNEIAIWQLAGDGWRQHLQTRLAAHAAQRASRFNTPASDHVDTLLLRGIGLPTVSSAWQWNHMTPAQARVKLDALVTLRGDVAHGQGGAKSVRKSRVTRGVDLVTRLISKTDEAVNSHVAASVGKPLF